MTKYEKQFNKRLLEAALPLLKVLARTARYIRNPMLYYVDKIVAEHDRKMPKGAKPAVKLQQLSPKTAS